MVLCKCRNNRLRTLLCVTRSSCPNSSDFLCTQPVHVPHQERDHAVLTELFSQFSQNHVRSSTDEDPAFVNNWSRGFVKCIRNGVLRGWDFLVYGSKEWADLQAVAPAENAPKVHGMRQCENFLRYKHRATLAKPMPKPITQAFPMKIIS